MKNTFGHALSVTLFGESHGEAIGAVLDGLTPGIPVEPAFIDRQLARRRPQDELSTARHEPDPYRIVSGVYEGKTTGTPLTILIPNADTKSGDYAEMASLARPGHADLTAYLKYHGFADPRGGGHFSGRLTAALVAAGAIVTYALQNKNIKIGTHIRECGGVADRPFDDPIRDLPLLSGADFPVLDPSAGERMKAAILKARADGDSVGGILETAVTGFPAGIGEPFFDTVESCLSHALFAIPAVKGVEFGDGFAFADQRGSEANDPFAVENGKIVTRSNHNGGINGGITNGMPLLFSCVVKPTPSISKTQNTVDFRKLTNETIEIRGRHDPAIVHRAAVVVESMTALVLADLLLGRYGTDALSEGN